MCEELWIQYNLFVRLRVKRTKYTRSVKPVLELEQTVTINLQSVIVLTIQYFQIFVDNFSTFNL